MKSKHLNEAKGKIALGNGKARYSQYSAQTNETNGSIPSRSINHSPIVFSQPQSSLNQRTQIQINGNIPHTKDSRKAARNDATIEQREWPRQQHIRLGEEPRENVLQQLREQERRGLTPSIYRAIFLLFIIFFLLLFAWVIPQLFQQTPSSHSPSFISSPHFQLRHFSAAQPTQI